MKRLQIADAPTMILALQDEIARSGESRYDHRLHGVLLAAQGISCYQVAEWLGQHPTTVERWVQRFEARGFSGLQEGERPGRPGRLDETTWQKIEQDLRVEPRQLGHAQNLWDGRLLSHHLRQAYGVELGVRQCQRLFRTMGFRRRKPRPVIAHADPEAQRAFKKTRHPGR
jgi:transposase